MKPKVLPLALLCLVFFLVNGLSAQVIQNPAGGSRNPECGTDLLRNYLTYAEPQLLHRQRQLDQSASEFFRSGGSQRSFSATITLPVVVHIIHQGPVGNISDAEVLQGIQNLNDAFANIGFYDQNTGVNTQIQFCLARRRPEGSPTTGINRVESPLTNLVDFSQDLQLKDLIRWDPLHYINIWLVNSIMGGVIAGYATLPSSHGQAEDGIVMLGPIVSDLGGGHSTMVHEMGHYLGLYHTFQNGCQNNDCLLDGDQVCDTPPDNSTVPPGDCSAIVNSCTTDAQSGFSTDQNDLNWNYLDYGNHSCRSGFTQGQSDRMNYFIENVRQSLLESQACQDPCLSAINAGLNTGATTVLAGTNVSFSNQTTGATSYQWFVNGTLISTSFSTSYFFDTPGIYTVLLQAFNNDPNCSDEDSLIITVNCNTQALFNSGNLYPKPGETVAFTNASSNATSFQWSVNDTPISNDQDFSYTFNQPGDYTICLEAEGEYCPDQFCQLVFVSEGVVNDSCESGFVMIIGEEQTSEEILTLIPTPEGNLLLGGSTGSNALLSYVTVDGDLIWEKKFKMTSGYDFIALLKIDSDGNLIINGRNAFNSSGANFFIKYDYINQASIWSNKYTIPSYSRFQQIIENPSSGNYIFLGMADHGLSSLNNAIAEYDKNNGNLNWIKTYDSGGITDVWNYGQIVQNTLYAVGVERYGGLDRLKASYSKLDLNGNLISTKIHLKSPTEDSRLYGTRIFIRNDTSYVLARGSLTSSNLQYSTAQFYASDLNGNIFYAYNYDIPIGSSEHTTRMIELPDGFAIMGRFYNDNTSDYDCYISRINKSGEIIWAKRISTPNDDLHKNLVYYDGFIYFVAMTRQTASSNYDVLFGKIDLDGNIGYENCPYVSDLTIYRSELINPYSAFHNLSEVQITTNTNNSTTTFQESALYREMIPDCSCDIDQYCPNGAPLHKVPDAVISQANYSCAVDSLELSFQLCNMDSFPIPAGTPVSIYNGNPTLTPAGIIGQIQTATPVLPNECIYLQVTIPSFGAGVVYIVANDDGSITPPFNLDGDFPSTDLLECDYTNNMGSVSIDYTPPTLNLQDQIATCDFQPATFDAGGGFAEYTWQDGSHEQAYTAWQPGTYWVTVRDSCGGIQSDTVQFIFAPATQLEIGIDSIEICLGDSVDISLSGFDAYQWTPGIFLSCDTCSTVTLFPDSSMCYYVVANTEDGCYSIDTLCVVIKSDTAENEQYQLLCPGDSVSFNGEWITEAGTYEFVTSNGNCFILNRLVVELSEVPELSFTTSSPCPDEQNGMITAVASGGVAPYIYQWPGMQGPVIGNIGSGYYSVTVTDAQGCIAVDSVLLENLPEPQIEFSVSAPLCQNDSNGILEILDPVTGFLFGLTPQTLGNNHVFGNLPAGTRTLFFRDTAGCTWDTAFLVPEAVPFWIELPPDTTIFCGDSITLQANSSSPVSIYTWAPATGLSCSNCPEPVAGNSQSQTYTLTAISADGCVAIDSMRLEIDDEGRIYIPNAFTPNGDGINDIFYIFGDNIDKVLVFRVFDRWGGMVHEKENFPANDPAFGWDGKHKGKAANIDVYAWYARLQLCNGSVVFKKGDVTLLR